MVTDKIHACYPNVKVIVGALMNAMSDFAEGLLSLPIHADGMSFHHHYPYPGQNYKIDEKMNWLRARTNLPLYLSETSMIYMEENEENEIAQAEYADYLKNVRGVETVIWYGGSFNGWRNSDLLRGDKSKKPAWYKRMRE